MSSPFEVFTLASDIPGSQQSLWEWHNRPGAFERLIPPWEQVTVLEHGEIAEGNTAEFVIRLGPVKRNWKARYRDVTPPTGFVDEQVEGPFSTWIHHHLFEAVGPDRCRLSDRVEYSLPFGPLGQIASQTVPGKLRRSFEYRHRVTQRDMASHLRFAHRPRMKVVVAGASGLVGRALTAFLTSGGHQVTKLVRRDPRPGEARWDPAGAVLQSDSLAGADAMVVLSGASIAGGRWTRSRKRLLRDSRIDTASLAANTIAAMDRPPSTLIVASAVGVYGDRADEILTEESAFGSGYLAELGQEWEQAAEPARKAGVRVINARMGVVLTPAGGALAKMLPVFRLGLGGRLGSGRQWMSWISHDDAIAAIHHVLMTPELSGPLNLTAPHPVTNGDFSSTLGRVLGRPALAPVPAAALRIALGEMADEALLASTRVVPQALERSGFQFSYPTLVETLKHVLGKS